MVLSKHRTVLVGVFAAIVCAMLSVTATQAEEVEDLQTTPSNAIVERAFNDLGTWGGQCWTWMRQVIEDATGKSVGFDYREGFFEAGAIEVTIDEAQPGDVIQLADDSYTAPDAGYDGLHTAIIYEVLGDGLFMVIDSNANFDEMVSTRLYDPAAAAARYSNITFHIYRFGDFPADAPRVPAPAPAVAVPLEVGDTATVNTPGECLNIRASAGRSAQQFNCLPHGTVVKVTSETAVVDGLSWVKVSANGVTGWVASDYLRKTEAQGSGVGPTRPAQTFRLFIPLIGADN